jgi:acyl dehydratase
VTAYFEDLTVGETVDLGTHCFSAEDIKAFARLYDPQPFHLDEDAAKASHFGALCASGWHTAAIWMKLVVGHHEQASRQAIKDGRRPARLGPSPGFTDLQWIRPVYAGDVLRYGSTMTRLTESASRPGWGLVSLDNTADNQDGTRVFRFQGVVFWERRPRA